MARSEIDAAVCSDTGRKRKANEDSSLLIPDAGVFCVADGMGGVEGGAVASQQTVKILADALGADPRSLSFAEKTKRVRLALQVANRWILNRSAQVGTKGSGTTFVGLILDFTGQDRGVFLHAGDSRGYRLRGGALTQITRDHSVATAFGAYSIENVPDMFKNVIVNAIGTQESFSLERTPVSVEASDVLLLCSDGLTGMVPDPEIQRILTEKGAQPAEAARALVDAANKAGGVDNITAVVVRVTAPLNTEAGVEDPATDTRNALLTPPSGAPRAEPQHAPPITDDSEIFAGAPKEETPTSDRSLKSSRARLLMFLGSIAAAAVAASLWVARNTSPAPSRVPSPAPTPATVVVAPPPSPALSADELRALLDEHLANGRFGDLDARLRRDPTLQAQFMAERDYAETLSGWTSEWNRRFNAPGAAPGDFDRYRGTAQELMRKLNAPADEEPLAAWPDDPAHRADQFCRLMRRHQQEIAEAAAAAMDQAQSDLQLLGDRPEATLTLLETTAGQPGLNEAASKVVGDMVDFRRWLDRSRSRPISGEELARVAIPFASRMQDIMDVLRGEVLARVMALSPESLRAVVPSDEVPAVLEIKRRNLSSYASDEPPSVWREAEFRSRLRTVLNYLRLASAAAAPAPPPPATNPS